MSFPRFHIALDGPAHSTFSSFPSTELGDGEPSKISLAMIRAKCGVSPKLFFTADGKTRIADSTMLDYYISVTKQNPVPTANQTEKEKGGKSGDGNGDANGTIPTVSTIVVQVITAAEKTPKPNLALPSLLRDLKDFMNEHNEGDKSQLGQLPSIGEANRQLAGLTGDWATASGSSSLPEPAELTEQQWDRILSNNRALHGYLYDSKLGILIKAPKRAFRIRSETKATQTGAQDGGKSGTEPGQELKPDLPIIPPFFVNDDAEVTVTEIQRNFQNTMTNEGFSSVAVEANAGADVFGAAVSVSTAWSNEHSYANQKEESRKVDSLHVAYKFPRVVVELDPDCLELTEECRKEAEGVVNTAMRDKFYEKYGTVFVTRFTLGGFLHSKRNLTEEEQRNLSQTKEKTRVAAGVNFQASRVSAGSNFSKVDSSSTEEGSASLNQDLRLTWEARGGDTLLCSNPSAWASTVKDYRLWRLMEQQRVVKMESLIKDVDIVAWTHLTDLSGNTDDGKDPIKDPEFNQKVRNILLDALMDPENNKMARDMREYYQSPRFNLEAYNAFVKEMDDPKLTIKPNLKWAALSIDQQVGVGLWMVSLKLIKVN